MNFFSKNLRYLRRKKNLSQDKLAELLGYKSFTTIQKWEEGRAEPSLKILNEIAKLFNIDLNSLTQVNLDDPVSIKNIPGAVLIKNLFKIPILGRIICGDPLLSYENYEGYFPADPDIVNADFALYAVGDSMMDANISEGDLVFFKKTPIVENGAIAAVLIDDETTLKKFYKNDSTIILQPCNDDYSPQIYGGDRLNSIKILGEMVAVLSRRNK